MLPFLRKWKQISTVRSGYLYIATGRLRHPGQASNQWSNAAGAYISSTDAKAYGLAFSISDVYSPDYSERFDGLSLRCLAD